MANPKSKILPRISAAFVVIILFYCIDIFYPSFMFDLNTFGVNIIGCVCSLVTVFAVCVARRKTIFEIGFSPLLSDFFKGLVSGVILSVLPILIVAALQGLLYLITKLPIFELFFITPNSNGDISLMNVSMFACAGIFYTFSKEIFYRGYIIRSMRPVYPFFDANIVQASLSVLVPLLLVLRNLLFGYYTFSSLPKKIIFIVVLVLFTAAYTFIGSIKRGMLARVQGNIWPSFFENFFSLFLGYSIFVGDNMITTYQAMVKLLLVEVISFVFTLVHYRKQYSRNKKRLEKNKEEFKKRQEEYLRQQELMEKDPDLMDINDKSVQDIVNNYNRQMIDNIGKHVKKE